MKDWDYQPAKDHGLEGVERLRSLQREPGLLEWMSQAAWRLTTRAYLAAYHRLEITGRERLPAQAPMVLVANHCSHLDTLALAAALPWHLRQTVFPIAAGDVFFETPAAAFFAAMMLNALPMWRKQCGSHALKTLRARLASEPVSYILFPEGTRSRDGELGKFRPGIGMLVASAPVPVVPCRLRGCFAAFPPGRRLPAPHPLHLTIGHPLIFEKTPDTREGWDQISTTLRTAIEAL